MDAPIASPSLEDVAAVEWELVVAEAAKAQCWDYCSGFCKAAGEAERGGDERARNVYAFLARVTSLAFHLDERDTPLGPADRLDGFTEHELRLLADLAGEISDPELQARAADILWLRNFGENGKRAYRFGQIAVRAYLASASRLEDPDHWPAGTERTERALQVARSLGKSSENQLYADVLAYIGEVLDRYHGTDPLFLSARMMELLQDQQAGEPTKYASYAEIAARRAEDAHRWDIAREYWTRKARWHELSGDVEGRRAALVAAAETYVLNGEDRLQGDRPDYLVASVFYRDAIEAYRRIGGMRERCEQLHRRMLDYQEKGAASMGRIQVEGTLPDVTELVESVRGHVRGKLLFDGIVAVATVARPQDVKAIRQAVGQINGQSVIHSLFPRALLNARGRLQKEIAPATNESDSTVAVSEDDMFEYAAQMRSLTVRLYIMPALEQFIEEHHVRVRDLAPLVMNNPFVPPGRELIFARGLHAGLTGDFMVALHLLIPQVEHSMRVLLESRAVIVSGLEDDRTQPERGLNTTLERPEAVQLLGDDLAFDLRGLLVEKAGSNLRHATAHGLLDAHIFQGTEAVYSWWIVLHICAVVLMSGGTGSVPGSPPAAE